MTPAHRLFLCNNCGKAVAVFPAGSRRDSFGATAAAGGGTGGSNGGSGGSGGGKGVGPPGGWLKVVHNAPPNAPVHPTCPACGNASCVPQPCPQECRVLWIAGRP